MLKFLKFVMMITTFAVVILQMNCNKENPTSNNDEPKDTTKPRHKYNLFVGSLSKEIFIIDPDSNIVTDTLRVPKASITSFAITDDGRKIFVATKEGPVNYPGEVYSIDRLTKQVKDIHSKASDVFLTPNGEIFIFSYEKYNNIAKIGIIDPALDVVNYIDSIDFYNPGKIEQQVVFDKSHSIFYTIDNQKRLFAYDYYQKKIVHIYNNISGYYTAHMVISSDGRYLYVAGGPVFDLKRDSVVGVVEGNFSGSLALSPDGKYLYVTDPGMYGRPEPLPSGKVYVFNTETKSYESEIDFRPHSPDNCCPITDQIVLLPYDGEIAYVSGWLDWLYVVNLKKREVIKKLELDVFTVPLAFGRKILINDGI